MRGKHDLNAHHTFSTWTLTTTALVSALSLASLSSAHADAATDAPAAQTIQEVVVTAEKRSNTVSKTPIAISAFNNDMLKDAGVVNVADIQNIAPAVQMGRDGFGVNINIRGVTSTDNTSKGDEGIAFNVDGIPIGRPIEEGLSFFDVERVEVLRGPQGTLYGKSSTGGAINVITNKPKDTFSASADVEYGNYNARRGDAVINMPLTDKLDVRAAVNFNDRDGFLKTSLAPAGGSAINQAPRNDQADQTGRISALYKFTPTATLILTFTDGAVGGVGQAQAIFNNVENKSGAAQRAVYGNPFGGHINDTFENLNAEFNADLGFLHLTYDGGRLSYNAHEQTSGTNDPYASGAANQVENGFTNPLGPAGPFVPFAGPAASYSWRDYRGHFLTNSQEVRFSNANPGPVDFVVGANWYKEQIHESDHNWSAPFADPTVADSVNGIDPVNTTTHTSYGVFGQATWHINSVFSAILGLRQAHDEVTRVGTFAAPNVAVSVAPNPSAGGALYFVNTPWLDPNGNICQAPNNCIGSPNNGHEAADKLTWRVGLNAQLTPSDLVYGSVATGYKAGGFNDFATSISAPSYAPEAMTAYELGYKGRPSDTIRYTSALFFYDYSSDQISSLISVGGSPVIDTRSASTQIYGWENEGTIKLTPLDTIDASLSFEKSKYTHFLTGPTLATNWDGKSLDKTPAAVLTLGYSHLWRFADGASFKVRLGTKYSTSYKLSDFVDAEQYEQKAYTRSDLTANYTAPDGKLTVQAFIHNIEDKMQAQSFAAANTASANVYNSAGATAAVSEPRMIGVRVGFKY